MTRRTMIPLLLACLPSCAGSTNPAPSPAPVAATFVSVEDLDSTIIVDARYFGSHNFVGRRINGYEAPKCLLTREAAEALAAVQRDVRAFGLSVKTYDCYRPQRAVDDFVRWAADTADVRMRTEFYPAVDKRNLFRDGYIAERSGHSRGSTVDLTLVPLPAATEPPFDPAQQADCRAPAARRFGDNGLDMGTGYDCFDPLSHTANPAVGATALRNRLLLKAVMEKHGFVDYEQEWWHFTLADEPFPSTWFDVPVR